jgi:hypothetical protein
MRPWDEVLVPNKTVLGVAAHSTLDEDISPDLYKPRVFIGFSNLEVNRVVCSTQYTHVSIHYISVMSIFY